MQKRNGRTNTTWLGKLFARVNDCWSLRRISNSLDMAKSINLNSVSLEMSIGTKKPSQEEHGTKP